MRRGRSLAVANADHAPLPAHQLVIATFGLYRRYPLLFLVLAAAVVVPYEAIVLAVTGAGPLESPAGGIAALVLTLTDAVLLSPLISALHVHAVREAREEGEPRLAPIARQGLRVLPVVAAVAAISWLGITIGFMLLIAPGVILMLRWAVVAQAAAIEHEGWLSALRRSHWLTDGHYWHVFVFTVGVFLIASVPSFLIGKGLGDVSSDAVSFLVGASVEIVVYSFAALATALLYYDLRARLESSVAQALAEKGLPRAALPLPTTLPRAAATSWDPRDYSPQERPSGWYVDPSSPDRMRYWGSGDTPGWGGTIRTPRKIRSAWQGTDQDQ